MTLAPNRTAVEEEGSEEETRAMPLAALPDPEPDPREETGAHEREREDAAVESHPAGERSPVLTLIEQTRAERAARNERVADLFPRPETTEWKIREVAYDRRRRAVVSAEEVQQAS